jgi:6-methylsalicylate decarboxylase
LPADHIIFGTDWPYAALPTDGRDPSPRLATLEQSTRQQIEGVNASALVPRLLASARRSMCRYGM